MTVVLFVVVFIVLQAPAESQDSCEEDEGPKPDETSVQWR
jgi:hypothetical protein